MLFKVSCDKEIHILKSTNARTLQELKALIPKVFKLHPVNFYLTYLDEDADEITLTTEPDFSILLGGGTKSAKILIREKSEDFYDQTQRLELEEEDHLEIENLIEKDSLLNEASEIRSNVPQEKSIDESIEEKLRNMLPELITKITAQVREEVMSQSNFSEASKLQPSSTQESMEMVSHPHIICDGCGMDEVTGVRYKCSVCRDFDLCSKCESISDHPHPFLKIKHPRQNPLKIMVVMRDEEDSLEVNGARLPMNGLSNLIEEGAKFAQQFMQGFNVDLPAQPKQEEKKEEEEEEEEEKVVEKIEEKVEEQIEPSLERKVPQKQSKVERKQRKSNEREKRQTMEHKILLNAHYLCEVGVMDFTESYKFAQKYHELSQEGLLNYYLSK